MAGVLEDGNTLVEDLAIVQDEHWKLDSLSVGLSGLESSPLLTSVVLVFKFDSTCNQSVSGHLGASLKSEVIELWHSFSQDIQEK